MTPRLAVMTPRLAALAIALCGALPAVAHAQASRPAAVDPRSPVEQRRSKLYREAVLLADQGKWAEAAAKLREVILLRSAPRAWIGLGLAQQELGQLATAKRSFTEALEGARTEGNASDIGDATKRLEELKPRVPLITLQAGGVPGVRVRVEGEVIEPDEGAYAIDPGDRVLLVDAPGRKPSEVPIHVAEAERRTVDVSLAPIDVPASSGGVPAGAIVLGGAGVAAVGGGLVLWGIASADEEATRKNIGIAVAAGGGAMLGAGALWWALSPSKSEKPASAPVALVPLDGGAWVGVGGRF